MSRLNRGQWLKFPKINEQLRLNLWHKSDKSRLSLLNIGAIRESPLPDLSVLTYDAVL